jgi:hypothetical protein
MKEFSNKPNESSMKPLKGESRQMQKSDISGNKSFCRKKKLNKKFPNFKYLSGFSFTFWKN